MADDWLILAATLPTNPSALRVRVWRALKATGAATLRDGVYLLPASAPAAQALWDIERSIADAGADAHMLVVKARDDGQAKAFRGLFDRSEPYAELLQSIKALRSRIGQSTEAELHRQLRTLDQRLLAIQASDFFPGNAGETAASALAALRREVEQHLSPGEPEPSAAAIEALSVADFQGRTWATRKRPWVDRLATAWLIRRFVDRSPTFVWIDGPTMCPAGAIGYDFDGARFTHVGDKVSFEVVAAAFSLADDPGIRGVGQLVHCIDLGGIPVDEAPGFELLVRGLQAQHPTDDALLAAALPLFDTLQAALQARR